MSMVTQKPNENKTSHQFIKERGLEAAVDVFGWLAYDNGLLVIPYPEIPELTIPAFERRRDLNNSKGNKGKWPVGGHPTPYFLRGEPGAPTIIVEGESDAATAKLCFPLANVIGVPGAYAWQPEWWLLSTGTAVVFLDADVERGLTGDKTRKIKNVASVKLAKAIASTRPKNVSLSFTAAFRHNTSCKDINDILRLASSIEKTTEILRCLADEAEEVSYASDIEEALNLLDQHLRPTTKDMDRDRKCICPFHNEDTPSFDYGPKGATCFACDVAMNIELLAAIHGIVVVSPVNRRGLEIVSGLEYFRAATQEPPSWFWEGLIGTGLLTLMAGIQREGGKSTLIAHLLHELTRGGE